MLLLYFLRSFSSVAVSRLSRFLTFTRLRLMLGIVVMALTSHAALAAKPTFTQTTRSGNTFSFPRQSAGVREPKNAFDIVFDTGGQPIFTSSGALSVPWDSVPLNVSGPVDMRSAAGAFGRFFRKALPLMATGFALYDLCRELLHTCRPDGTVVKDGTPVTFQGYEFGRDSYGYSPSPQLACQREVASNVAPNRAYDLRLMSSGIENGGAFCIVDRLQVGTQSVVTAGVRVNLPRRASTACVIGSFVNPDGTCSSTLQGEVVPFESLADLIASRSGWPSTSKLIPALKDALNSGETVDVTPTSVTGPLTENGPASTKTNPDGSTETTRTTNNYNYEGNRVTVTQTTTIINHNPTTNTTTTTTVVVTPQLPPAPEIETCGYPGGPKCQIDETGTPSTATLDIGLPKIKADTDAYNDSVKSPADKGMFDQLKQFFDAPPLVQCQPFAMPSVMSIQIPPVDPCPVVGGVRDVMAFVWAFVGMFMGIGFIREAI